MPRRPDDDDVARGSAGTGGRPLVVVAGFLLAAGATAAVFLTDNPQYLRVAVVAVAWAFVLATFAAGRRGSDRVAAAAREGQLRRAYEHELDLEVAARREYELELENELRRDSERAMREELDALRGEFAALAGLREQVAGVADLRSDVAGLAALRDEVARLAALREDIAALASLRQELGMLHELRDDMGRLRAELTEQLSSEMLVERIVMRTQASRLPGEASRLDAPARTLEGGSWSEETPRELTGGWPAVRLGEPTETRQFEQVRVERNEGRAAPATHTTSSWTPPAPATAMFAGPRPSRLGPPPSTGSTASTSAGPTPHTPPPQIPAVHTPPPSGPVPPAAVPLGPATTAFPLLPPAAEPPVPAAVQPPATPELRPSPPRPSPRRRRGDEPLQHPSPVADALTAERSAPPSPEVRVEDRGGYRVAMPEPAAAQPAPSPHPAPSTSPGTGRLAEILAENGVTPTTGGRRRRRYREDGDSDDVLSRVLGRD